MIKIAVCDDDAGIVKELTASLTAYMTSRGQTFYTVSPYAGGRALLESGLDHDIIFLDIQMEQLNGLETAKALRRQKKTGLLIFITILKECVFDVFEVEAYDYLLKPIKRDRFERTMDRAMRTLEQRTGRHLMIQRGTTREIIPLEQILYCEVRGRKIYIHQKDEKVTDYYDRLEDLERRLPGEFFRCHRSYLVNLGHVRGCGGEQLTLTGGICIPVSRLRERALTQALLRYMKERTV